jgi:hypothetical protein
LICCFFTEASSTWVLSVEPCLNTTGPLEIEAADVVFEDVGSKRFAYKERPPPRDGLGAEEFDIFARGGLVEAMVLEIEDTSMF